MDILYTPTYSYLHGFSNSFLHDALRTYMSWLEEDEYGKFTKAVPGFPIGKETIFKITGTQDLTVMSGYLMQFIQLLKAHKESIHITSSVTKYKCSDVVPNEILYTHQKKIVTAAVTYNRGIIQSPTGSGKSFVIAELVNKYFDDNLQVLVTVPTINLLHQLTEDIKQYCILTGKYVPKIGKVGDGKYDFKQITVGIPQSLCKSKCDTYLSNVQALVADEVHTCATPTYAKMITKMQHRLVSLGLSATPNINGANNIFLTGFFGDTIIEVTETDMIQENIILEPIFKYYPAPKAFVPNNISQFANRISDLKANHRYKVLNQVYEYVISNNTGRNKLIVNLAIKKIEEEEVPLIIIVNKIRGEDCHGMQLYRLLQQSGYDLPIMAGHISKKKQQVILDDLKESKILGCRMRRQYTPRCLVCLRIPMPLELRRCMPYCLVCPRVVALQNPIVKSAP